MTPEEISRLIKEVDDLQRMLRSVDRRVATLPQINEKVSELKIDIINLRKRYSDEVTPNIKTWNETAMNQKWVTRAIVGAVLAALLALIRLN